MIGALDGIKRQILECINSAYDKGYKAGIEEGNIDNGTFAAKVKEAYNNGLNDAEKAIKRIIVEPSKGGLYANELQEIFGTKGTFVIFLKYSISEIIEKIREYDDKKAERNANPDNDLHIGDEVYSLDSKYKYVVLAFLDNGKIFVLSGRGLTGLFAFDQLHKTGRRFAIGEILKELKGE